MQTIVQQIFKAFGTQARLVKSTGIPAQTVNDWQRKGRVNIPHWRRPSIIEAAQRLDIQLPPEVAAYLASKETASEPSPGDEAKAA